jgi:hypothetical protein
MEQGPDTTPGAGARIIAVGGGKGGVGKSVVAANLAVLRPGQIVAGRYRDVQNLQHTIGFGGSATRLDGTIIMYDQNMTPVAEWNFFKGWPSKISGPDIKAENDFGVTKVRAVEKPASAEGATLRYRFPPHSYTMLKTKLA